MTLSIMLQIPELEKLVVLELLYGTENPEFNGTLKWPKSYLIYLESIVTTTKAVSYEPRYEATHSNSKTPILSTPILMELYYYI